MQSQYHPIKQFSLFDDFMILNNSNQLIKNQVIN